ncbi:MAG: alpha-E domain-containing protein, partial [Pseudomonadota bacterium]
PEQSKLLIRAQRMRDELRDLKVADILDTGLHEWLTDTIMETNRLAMAVGQAYGFGGPVAAEAG